jgi:hypothetical protein
MPIERIHQLRQRVGMAIISEFGTIDYDPKYDYKKQRRVA